MLKSSLHHRFTIIILKTNRAMKTIVKKIQEDNKLAVSRLFFAKHQSEYKYCVQHYANYGWHSKFLNNSILECNEMQILLEEEFRDELFMTWNNPLYVVKVAVQRKYALLKITFFNFAKNLFMKTAKNN